MDQGQGKEETQNVDVIKKFQRSLVLGTEKVTNKLDEEEHYWDGVASASTGNILRFEVARLWQRVIQNEKEMLRSDVSLVSMGVGLGLQIYTDILTRVLMKPGLEQLQAIISEEVGTEIEDFLKNLNAVKTSRVTPPDQRQTM